MEPVVVSSGANAGEVFRRVARAGRGGCRLPPAGRRGRGGWPRAGRLSHRAVRIASPIAAVTLTLWLPAALVYHVYFDRGDLPDLAPFVLFQPPTTGEVTDARGEVVIQLAREYRRVLTYDDVPLVMRQAILAAEDKNFHSHSGSTMARCRGSSRRRRRAPWRRGGAAPGSG